MTEINDRTDETKESEDGQITDVDESTRGGLGQFLEERLHISVFNYTIPEHANSIWYALGGAAFVSFLLLILTGTIMSQFYSPTVSGAHESINYIIKTAPLGWFIKGMHSWAAQLMLLALLIHLGRVIVTGSYKKPREITFYLGLLLFLTAFLFISTGTMVKWDQEGYEALTHFVGTFSFFGAIGSVFSSKFTPATHMLSRIYALHVSTLPLALVFLLAGHFYLVKVLKISPLPRKPQPEKPSSATFSQHVRLLVKVGLGVTALVVLLALVFRPPFGAPPTPMETGIKPPWMFLWLYALENQLGLIGIVYGMFGMFGALAAFPLIDRGPELRLTKRKPALLLFGLIIVTLIVLSYLGWASVPVIHSDM